MLSVTKKIDNLKVHSALARVNASSSNIVIDLNRGDPTMYKPYWKRMGDKSSVTFSSTELSSYFSDPKAICWYMEPQLGNAIKRVHQVACNAVTGGRHIVVGTGSTQLTHAVLYALSSAFWAAKPVSVVCEAPYYSAYKEQTEVLRSEQYKWAGGARTFDQDGPYIELVTSPNNPDGSIKEAVVKRENGKVVHDLAYYWPQYTPITAAADHDIMLFTLSKCTGHAGSRIGWALVKDEYIARKMTEFMMLTTIGVSKEAQIRAAKLLNVVCDSCQNKSTNSENFFEYGKRILTERWDRLRDVIGESDMFTLPKYPKGYCMFSKETTESVPAFAWLKCKKNTDCHRLFARLNISTRGGQNFGVDETYCRISMLGEDAEFDIFLQRMSMIKQVINYADNIGVIAKL